jgi:hypothetical protein
MDYVLCAPGGPSPEDDGLVLLFAATAIVWSNFCTEPPERYGFFLGSMLAVAFWLRWKTASDGSRNP